MPKITFSNRNNEFYQSLKTAVDEYFEKKAEEFYDIWQFFKCKEVEVKFTDPQWARVVNRGPGEGRRPARAADRRSICTRRGRSRAVP